MKEQPLFVPASRCTKPQKKCVKLPRAHASSIFSIKQDFSCAFAMYPVVIPKWKANAFLLVCYGGKSV